MPRFSQLSLTLLSILILTACGGGGDGGGSGTSATRTLSGVAADGYLQGAFVCIDRNDNLHCDSDEPRTTSNSEGAYTLDGLTDEDVTQHRVLVEVHTGVFDSDNPGIRVDMPYILTAPLGKHAFISPFSTLVAGVMLQHPELSQDQAVDLISGLLNTPSALLLDNYLTGELGNPGKQRLHRMGRGLAREIAYFVKHARLVPAYASKFDNSILSALAMYLTGPERIVEILDGDFFDTSVNRKYLDSAERDDAIEEVRTLISLVNKPANTISYQDFLKSSGTRFIINDVFPADCHDYNPGWIFPESCPADYPAASAYLLGYSSTFVGENFYTGISKMLVSLNTGLTVHSPAPRYYSPVLAAGEWSIPDEKPQLLPLSGLDGDHIRSFDISGMNIRAFLKHTSLVNGQRFTDPLLMAIPAEAAFPNGAGASRYLSTTNRNFYALYDINPFNDTFEGFSLARTQEEGGAGFSSMTDFLDYLSPTGGNHTLPLGYKTELVDGNVILTSYAISRFTTDGEILLERVYLNKDGSVNYKKPLASGSWRKYNEDGAEFLEARFPAGVAVQDMPLIWTMYEGELVNVFFVPSGTPSETLFFNETAITAIRAALQN
ncbi:MAG TPA: hypothetical protein VFW42_11615 [Fluviicoccus sp.]|nr:hypothetical protein [Fluviicoccus sp.]